MVLSGLLLKLNISLVGAQWHSRLCAVVLLVVLCGSLACAHLFSCWCSLVGWCSVVNVCNTQYKGVDFYTDAFVGCRGLLGVVYSCVCS